MSYLNGYDVKEVIYENNFQRISICTKNEDNSEFYNNIILSSRIIDLLEGNLIKSKFDNIIEFSKDKDRAYVITKLCNEETIEEYISNNTLTMKEQLNLTENLLYRFVELEEFEDLIQESIITHENILIKDNKLIFKNLLKFSQDYDISESLLIKAAGDYIHYIYTGEFINDFNISDKLPPDIMRLVIRCYSNQYLNISQIIDALKNTATYSLVNIKKPLVNILNPEIEQPTKLNVKNKTKAEPIEVEETINDEEKNSNFGEMLGNRKLIAIILIIIIPLMILLLSRCNDKKVPIISEGNNNTNGTIVENANKDTPESNENNLPETINEFYSQELIDMTLSEKNAEIDFSKFYDGYSSLLIKNQTATKQKTLFAVIDINSDKLDYLKNRQVGLSIRLTTEVDNAKGSIIMEVRENNKISTYSSEKVSLTKDIWTLNQSTLNLGEVDRIELYYEYDDIYPIWVDGIEIGILK